MARSVASRFDDLLRKALDTAMRSARQSEPHVRDITHYIDANRSEDALDAMLDVYYATHEALEMRGGKDAAFISASIFEQLARLRIEVASFFDPWLQRAFRLLATPPPPPPPPPDDDPFRKRYERLTPFAASTLHAYLERRRKDKKDSLTFTEILIDLFWQKQGVLPEDDRQLFAFAPNGDAALRKDYDTKVGAVLVKANGGDGDGTEAALKDFVTWAYRPHDMASAFQILLWSRAIVAGFKGKREDLSTRVFHEIYLVSIQRAVTSAINAGYHTVQSNFLSEEEVDVLIQPLVTAEYFSDYADRLYPFSYKGGFAAGSTFVDLAALHLRLLVFAQARTIYLLSAQKRDEVANALLSRDPAVMTRSAWVGGSLGQLAHTMRIGSRIGEAVTVVFLYPSGDLVVVFKGMEHFPFQVSMTTAGRWLDDHFVDKLYEGTAHLLVLIPALFEVLQYTAVFITGGFLALLEEIVEDQIVDAAAGIVEDVTGSRTAGMITGLVGNPSTLLVGSRKLVKGAGRTGIKAIRKVKAKFTRKDVIPRAYLVNRKGRKVRPPKPKAKALKPLDKAQQRRILRTEADLKDLKTMTVKLGKSDGRGGFHEVNGHEAVAMLFRDKIDDIPRLKQHWPTDLQKTYLAEIRDALKKGIKDPTLNKEMLAAFDRGAIKPASFGQLSPKLQRQIKDLVKDRWDSIRTAFWRRVRADKQLVADLAAIKIRFKRGSSPGSAPDLELGGGRMKLSLDHVKRKVENPLEAFSADNLRILTGRDNSVLKEGIVRNIRDTTGLDLDAFSAGTGNGAIPQSFREGLAKVLDDSPEEADIWRSFEDPAGLKPR